MGQSFSSTSSLTVFVNGKRYVVDGTRVDPSTPLSTWLRDERLVGTKVGCGTGACGACTVMVSSLVEGHVIHRAVNACLMPVCLADLCHVTTVEGSDDILTRVKEAFSTYHASQCGFCTPGFVMAIYTQLRNNPDISSEELLASLDGNLCRCTGYRPILDAAASLCPCKQAGEEGGDCCQSTTTTTTASSPSRNNNNNNNHHDHDAAPRSGEFIFPPQLRSLPVTSIHFQGPYSSFVRPTTLAGLQGALEKFGTKAVLIGGCTSHHLQRLEQGAVLISTQHVPDLRGISLRHGRLHVGASTTVGETLAFLKQSKDLFLPQSPCGALLNHLLPWIGSTQTRSAATWGGACALAESDSDLLAFLGAVGAEIDVGGKNKRILSVQQLLTGPGRTSLVNGVDFIVSVAIPAPPVMSFVQSFKFNPRPQLSRSIVGGTCVVKLAATGKVQSLFVSLVGLKPTVVIQSLELGGVQWTLIDAAQVLLEESRKVLHPMIDENQNAQYSAQYRKDLCDALLYEFLGTSAALFSGNVNPADSPFPPFKSAALSHTVAATQSYQIDSAIGPVGAPLVNHSAKAQSAGLAFFADDEASASDTVYCVPVLSRKAHAKFKVDDAAVRQMPGVVDVLYAADVNARPNAKNSLGERGFFLADGEVVYWGQPLAVVVATSQISGLRAAVALKVDYYEELPAVTTIEQAIRENSVHELTIRSELKHGGDVDAAFEGCDFILESSFSLGATDHFYLEPHSCTVTPNEDASEFQVVATTQNIQCASTDIAQILGVDMSRVNLRVRRLGGGFGGKGTPSLALPALAAAKLLRPARMTLTRWHDMVMTTKRGETLIEFKVGTKANNIVAMDVKVFYAGGYFRNDVQYIPFIMGVQGMASYEIPNFRCRLNFLRLNRAPTGPFRGAGIPQGCAAMESILERVAVSLKQDPDDFRMRHLRADGSVHLGVPIPGKVLQRATLDQVLEMSQFEKRKKEAHEFNVANKWKKRGIAMQAYGHPITHRGFAMTHQGRGLVHVAPDGSVTIAHQGIEMGQGVHQKMLQVVAHELNVPLHRIRVAANSTDALGHSLIETGGSIGSEQNASALRLACARIKENARRICELNKLNPDETPLSTVAGLALAARIPLSDWATSSIYDPQDVGSADGGFKYWVWGASVVECEVDVCTGFYQFTHASLCLDVGVSFNPAIDVGQLEGGFIQGLSWVTRERLLYDPVSGRMLNANADGFHVAVPLTIPREFKVKLLPSFNEVNAETAYGSKAVGEPPVSLSMAGLIALQRAVNAARSSPAWLNLPATHMAVREAIGASGHPLHEKQREQEENPQ